MWVILCILAFETVEAVLIHCLLDIIRRVMHYNSHNRVKSHEVCARGQVGPVEGAQNFFFYLGVRCLCNIGLCTRKCVLTLQYDIIQIVVSGEKMTIIEIVMVCHSFFLSIDYIYGWTA